MTNAVAALILAAGASARMKGRDKLLEAVDGEPLLRRQARIAAEAGAEVFVTLPLDRPARDAALAGLPVVTIAVPDAALGMSASLRAGVTAVAARGDAAFAGLMILPADMPEFSVGGLTAMLAAFRTAPDRILRGAAPDGRPGHPAIFPRAFWPQLTAVEGDRGGIGVIRANPARVDLFVLPGLSALTDLDTPEDWAAWRASRDGDGG